MFTMFTIQNSVCIKRKGTSVAAQSQLLYFYLLIIFSSCTREETMKEYYGTGTLRYEYVVKDGRKNGKYRMFYEDGALMRDGQYKDDFLLGWNSFYYPNGKVRVQSLFDMYNGRERLARRIYFNEGGDTISDMSFALKNILFEQVNEKEYRVGDTLVLRAKIMDAKYKYCEAVLGKFDKNLNTLELPDKMVMPTYGNLNHEITMAIRFTKPRWDTLTFMVSDYDIIQRADSTQPKAVGEMSFARHIVEVKPVEPVQ